MPYQLLPNIIFIFAVLGILLVILRHLPEAISESKAEEEIPADKRLNEKGLPTIAISKARLWLKVSGRKTLNFLLEAKDVKPNSLAGYKIKKLFGNIHQQVPPLLQTAPPTTSLDSKDEQYFLDQIKNDPKNLNLYANLGKYYLEHDNFTDAKDIYGYLTLHEPADSEHYGKLGFCYYRLGEFEKAIESYQKSIDLDSTQPNRFYNLGRSYEALQKLEDAEEAFEHAISLEPGNGKYYVSLSNVQLGLGQRNDAKVTLRKARKLDPANEAIAEKLKKF